MTPDLRSLPHHSQRGSCNERSWNTLAIDCLFYLDVRRLDDRRPARDLALDQREKRLRPAIWLVGNIAPEDTEALACGLVVERLVEGVNQPVEDRLRRRPGCEQAVPGRRLK